MLFNLSHTIEILERTPITLRSLLSGLSDEWVLHNEGPDTWSVFDVVGHLIHGEKTDWIQRLEIILSDSANKNFEPFDRFAQLTANTHKTLSNLLTEFETLRLKNIQMLKSKNIGQEMFGLTANHPALGVVTLTQLLSTWAVHDLNHLAQISRVMASQYQAEVGPWKAYISLFKNRK